MARTPRQPLGASILAAYHAAPPSTTLTFFPVADARVEESSLRELRTAGLSSDGGSKKRESYLRFQLPESRPHREREAAPQSTTDGRTTAGAHVAGVVARDRITWSTRPRGTVPVADVAAVPLGSCESSTSVVTGNGSLNGGLASSSATRRLRSRELTDARDGRSSSSPSSRGAPTLRRRPRRRTRAQAPAPERVDLTWSREGRRRRDGYEVLRDGQLIATLGAQTSYTDTARCHGRLRLRGQGLDAAGNRSPVISMAGVTTRATDSDHGQVDVLADAHVDESSPTRNFGGASKLEGVRDPRLEATAVSLSDHRHCAGGEAAVYVSNDGSNKARLGMRSRTWTELVSLGPPPGSRRRAGRERGRDRVTHLGGVRLPAWLPQRGLTLVLVGDSADSAASPRRGRRDAEGPVEVTFLGAIDPPTGHDSSPAEAQS